MEFTELIDPMFWKVLEKEQLSDFSQFHKAAFPEEVPLYSRESDVSFLRDQESSVANTILLKLSLDYLEQVISHETRKKNFFAAITVWKSPKKEPIVPHLFISSTEAFTRTVAVHVARTRFGRMIEHLVLRLKQKGHFEVLEDTSTVPRLARVFIGPSLSTSAAGQQ